jgi:hypothetical protein
MRKQNSYFRQADTQFVMQRWRANESCSLVGVGSIGKSNLMHHIAQLDTAKVYLGDDASKYKAVIVDANMLGALPAWNLDSAEQFRCWAGYELIMHRLYLDFYPLDVLGDDATIFFETYQALQDGTNPLYQYMGIRYLELGLEFFARRGIHIMLMFDEFEELLRQLPARFFQTLRGLRDRHKSLITFMTFSRKPINELIGEIGLPYADYESFSELFTDNVHFVGPYETQDALDMLQRLEDRHQFSLVDNLRQFTVYITGGYAGLIRAVFHQLLSNASSHIPTGDNFVDKLIGQSSIQSECETLWKSLSHIEQTILLSVSQGSANSIDMSKNKIHQAVGNLVMKKLLQMNQQTQNIVLHPPIFAQYIKHKKSSS